LPHHDRSRRAVLSSARGQVDGVVEQTDLSDAQVQEAMPLEREGMCELARFLLIYVHVLAESVNGVIPFFGEQQ
jgi:hypothetical protein